MTLESWFTIVDCFVDWPQVKFHTFCLVTNPIFEKSFECCKNSLISYLGDLLGRRFIFWITTAVVIIFMTAKTYLADYFAAYTVFKVIAASAYCASYQVKISS